VSEEIAFFLTDCAKKQTRRSQTGCRLMRNAGLVGVSCRKSTITTVRDGARQAPDLVDRNFTTDRPNPLWVADITYIPTWAGFLYLAVVLDVFSRRIVGWSMATTLHTQLVLDALKMAPWQRRPNSVIHHSDQGSQYTSIEFGKRCRQAGVRPSMGSVGDAYDNAMAESFFATLECELLDRRRFKTHAEIASRIPGPLVERSRWARAQPDNEVLGDLVVVDSIGVRWIGNRDILLLAKKSSVLRNDLA
jgi:transposase InsO family protein